MKTIKLKFYLEEKVTIVELERPGIVTSIWIGIEGTQYKVAYFNDGQRYEKYLYASEIRRAKK